MGKVANGVLAVGLLAGAAVGVETLTGVDIPGIPNLDGGQSEERAHGAIIIDDITAETASSSFQIQIGTGVAHVAIEASQNWDHQGTWFNGDFQSTNGTASVSDPDGGPANLQLELDFCVTGLITTTEQVDSDGNRVKAPEIIFDQNGIAVCDIEIEDTSENLEVFHQDDTPAWFQGDFEEAIRVGAINAVAAAPCPEDVSEYTTQDYLDYTAQQIAEANNTSVENVTVLPGTPRRTDVSTRAQLQEDLAALVDDEDLNVSYFSGGGEAVSDSCYNPVDENVVELNTLDTLVTTDNVG